MKNGSPETVSTASPSGPRPARAGLSLLRSLWTIAINAFRETIRDKILYNLVLFALGLILFSLLLGEWSVFAREKVIKDFTLAVMSLSGLLIAVFVGIGLIQKEIQRKTVLTLLAKPVPRWTFILGKYLGLLLVVGVNLAVMTACFYFVLWFTDSGPSARLLLAVYLLFMEMAVVVAVALLFSSFSTPTLSAVFTLGVYVAGHLSGDILGHLAFMDRMGKTLPAGGLELPDWSVRVIRGIYYLIPNLENFNLKGRVVYDLPIPDGFLLHATGYGLLYIALFLGISCLWFQRRDFI